MNTIIKVFIVTAIILALTILTNSLIPASFTDPLNASVQYFLNSLNILSFAFPMADFWNCMQILSNFFYGLLVFNVARWIVNMFIV